MGASKVLGIESRIISRQRPHQPFFSPPLFIFENHRINAGPFEGCSVASFFVCRAKDETVFHAKFLRVLSGAEPCVGTEKLTGERRGQ